MDVDVDVDLMIKVKNGLKIIYHSLGKRATIDRLLAEVQKREGGGDRAAIG